MLVPSNYEAAARASGVLRRWRKGMGAAAIAARIEGMTEDCVARIVAEARRRGDPRAVRRAGSRPRP